MKYVITFFKVIFFLILAPCMLVCSGAAAASLGYFMMILYSKNEFVKFWLIILALFVTILTVIFLKIYFTKFPRNRRREQQQPQSQQPRQQRPEARTLKQGERVSHADPRKAALQGVSVATNVNHRH